MLPSETLSLGNAELLTEIDDPAVVSNYSTTRDTISFEVDQVGKPVIVRTSFFPNWEVTGAEGPWRVGPNQMVVVPTATQVELSYGSTLVERGSYLISFASLAGIFMVYRRRRSGELALTTESLLVESAALGTETVEVPVADDLSVEELEEPLPDPVVEVLPDPHGADTVEALDGADGQDSEVPES